VTKRDTAVRRVNERAEDELRPVSIETGAMKFAEGSALIEVGDTRVLVAASLEKKVPRWLIDSGRGWVTAEYAMLPRATNTRSMREVSRGRPSGRSSEIQRLIGRSLRAVIDLKALANLTLTVDCDVLQADGGTRTAAITGAWVAAAEALGRAFLTGDVGRWPIRRQVAAVSVGVVEGRPLLDLDAGEDRGAEVDMNVVATSDGRLVEVQGTGEEHSFSRDELDRMLDLALAGIDRLVAIQNEALASLMAEVDAARSGERRAAPPKDERDLYGAP
jgi:ribonuclease PH